MLHFSAQHMGQEWEETNGLRLRSRFRFYMSSENGSLTLHLTLPITMKSPPFDPGVQLGCDIKQFVDMTMTVLLFCVFRANQSNCLIWKKNASLMNRLNSCGSTWVCFKLCPLHNPCNDYTTSQWVACAFVVCRFKCWCWQWGLSHLSPSQTQGDHPAELHKRTSQKGIISVVRSAWVHNIVKQT